MAKLAEAFHLTAGPSPTEAMAAFDAAIDMAVEGDYLYVAALAAEGAGRLQLQSGSSRAARSYLEEAEAAFVQWGAAGAARRVAALRGGAARGAPRAPAPRRRPPPTR
jgi:hypothetical protein